MKILSDFAAVIGIDWADQKHDLCLKIPGSDKLEFSVLEHSVESIDAWAMGLQRRFKGEPIAIFIESRKIPLIHALLKYSFFTLFPVNPQTLARYRRALRPSRAKDDPTDALLLIEIVERHPDQFPAWTPDSAEMRTLAQLVEMRRVIVAEKVRCSNRLTAALKQYYPQALDWFEDIDTRLFCGFIQRWPNLAQARRAHKATLRHFFHSHNARYGHVIDRRIEKIKHATPLTEDPGVIAPNQTMSVALVQQLDLLLEQVKRFDKEISACFKSLEDAQIFNSLPGAGKQFAPRLMVAFGENRDRFETAEAVTKYSGIAPVTERSGQKSWVHWRYSCPKFMRQSFIEWTRETTRRSFWARAYYKLQRDRGKSHQMAIRALAYKWIRIIYRCWKDKKPYDEAKYLLALKKKKSPLLQYLAD